jgi:DNA-binding MarR family transcriptional regulator
MRRAANLDVMFHSFLARFFSIPARQPTGNGVTFAQVRLLWILEEEKTASPSRLADRLGVSCSTITELLERLSRGGYVRKIRSDVDRRQVLISLQPKGRRVISDFARLRRERLRKLMSILEPRDAARMTGALRTLSEISGRWHVD